MQLHYHAAEEVQIQHVMSAPQSRTLWSFCTGALNAHAITSKLWQWPWLSWKWWQWSIMMKIWTAMVVQLWYWKQRWSSWPNKRKLSDIVLEVLIRKAWPTRGPDWLWEGSRPYLGIGRSSARVSNASQGPRRDGERYRVIQSDPCFHGAALAWWSRQTKNCFKQRPSNEVVQAREGSRPHPNLHLQWLTQVQCHDWLAMQWL